MKSIDSLCSPYSLARPIQPSDMGYALDPCIANLAQAKCLVSSVYLRHSITIYCVTFLVPNKGPQSILN